MSKDRVNCAKERRKEKEGGTMELINQAQYLLTLPKSLFNRIMDSAYMHDRHPMDEFIHRLYRSFEVEPDKPEDSA